MKKLVSILLVVLILVSCFVVSASAYDTEKDVSQYKYFEKLIEYYDAEYERSGIQYVYDELYYHYSDDSDEPDWALIFCPVNPCPIEAKYGTLVGDRILSVVGGGCSIFVDGYGVYVRETDSFIALRQNKLEEICELCPDFIESIVENEIGQQFGDVDNDGELSVIDVTYIQRFLAGYHDYIQTYFFVTLNGGNGSVLVPDFDRDGTTTIMDATAIQQKLAGIIVEPEINEELLVVEYEGNAYGDPYPEKPVQAQPLEFKREYFDNTYFRVYHNSGVDRFLAIIKSKEQFDYYFKKLSTPDYDEEFFEKYWIVASITPSDNEVTFYDIGGVSILNDTLYVQVDKWESIHDGYLNPGIPQSISFVSVEKEELLYVTDMVRVEEKY